MSILRLASVLIILGNFSCQSQTKKIMDNKNPLMCDPKNGICEIPTNNASLTDSTAVKADNNPVKLIYFYF